MKTIIRVGHPAYPHMPTNCARFCFSKAQAVRVLRLRGCTRDHAREVVALTIKHGGYTAHNAAGDYIECRDITPDLVPGWSYTQDFINRWKSQPEF